MQITIIDDNGQKYEKVLSNGRKGVGPEEAIRCSLQLLSSVFTPGHINYVLRKHIFPDFQ